MAGRPRLVSIYQKGKTWYTRFRIGERRIHTSFKTKDEETARRYKGQLENLLEDENSLCDDRVYEIFFGKKRAIKITEPLKEMGDPLLQQIAEYQDRIVKLQKRVEYLEPFEAFYNAYKQTEMGKAITTQKTTPVFSKDIPIFMKAINHLAEGNKTEHERVLKDFKKEAGDLRVSEYTPAIILDYLHEEAEEYENIKKRFNRVRTYLVRYFNWSSERYGFANPILKVKKLKNEDSFEDQIHWHELQDVLDVIEKLEPYWQRLISTFLYSGLSSRELQGLRKIDIVEFNGKQTIYVVPHTERTLKTKKRQRHVIISPDLQPTIEFQLKSPGAFLFPPTVGSGSLWNRHTFSRELNKRLPGNMNALSLRRTFGSLLLRSGKTAAQVAAAMGNSELMIRKHYARLLGSEVDTAFS